MATPITLTVTHTSEITPIIYRLESSEGRQYRMIGTRYFSVAKDGGLRELNGKRNNKLIATIRAAVQAYTGA